MATRTALRPLPSTASLVREDDVGQVSPWRLIWRRFRQNRLSVFGSLMLLALYLAVAFAEFVAPNAFDELDSEYPWAPPTPVRVTRLGLAFSPLISRLDSANFEFVFELDNEHPLPLRFFVRGYPYKLLGLFPADIHLVGVAAPAGAEKTPKFFLWGADRQGRDVFARVLHGGRVSLTVGVVSVAIATVLGSILGTASGYYGGWIDNLMQRAIELIQTFPTIPLWAALTAILPPDLPVTQRYIFITIILSFISWTGLARQVRGKVLSYRAADYTAAAQAAGASDLRIILTHLAPNSLSHIIVVAALAIPGTILGETALSFLGLGMLPPAVSWGVLIREAQQVQVILRYPWLLLPGVAVVLSVLCFSFLGDGLRDAADPYS